MDINQSLSSLTERPLDIDTETLETNSELDIVINSSLTKILSNELRDVKLTFKKQLCLSDVFFELYQTRSSKHEEFLTIKMKNKLMLKRSTRIDKNTDNCLLCQEANTDGTIRMLSCNCLNSVCIGCQIDVFAKSKLFEDKLGTSSQFMLESGVFLNDVAVLYEGVSAYNRQLMSRILDLKKNMKCFICKTGEMEGILVHVDNSGKSIQSNMADSYAIINGMKMLCHENFNIFQIEDHFKRQVCSKISSLTRIPYCLLSVRQNFNS